MGELIVRPATEDDSPAVSAIYGPYVVSTAISFETRVPSADEMADRIRTTTQTYPWLVAERASQVIGYAYASRHRDRDAYLWSVDVTVYVDASTHRQGVGRTLYTRLLDLLRKQGFFNAYAGITLPNPQSIGLHEALGFEPIGVYPNVGYKLGAWRSVGWWSLELQPPTSNPKPPTRFPDLELTWSASPA